MSLDQQLKKSKKTLEKKREHILVELMLVVLQVHLVLIVKSEYLLILKEMQYFNEIFLEELLLENHVHLLLYTKQLPMYLL